MGGRRVGPPFPSSPSQECFGYLPLVIMIGSYFLGGTRHAEAVPFIDVFYQFGSRCVGATACDHLSGFHTPRSLRLDWSMGQDRWGDENRRVPTSLPVCLPLKRRRRAAGAWARPSTTSSCGGGRGFRRVTVKMRRRTSPRRHGQGDQEVWRIFALGEFSWLFVNDRTKKNNHLKPFVVIRQIA